MTKNQKIESRSERAPGRASAGGGRKKTIFSKNRVALREGVRARVVVKEVVAAPAGRRRRGRLGGRPRRGLRRGLEHLRPLVLSRGQLPPELQVAVPRPQGQERGAQGPREAEQRADLESLAEAGLEPRAAGARGQPLRGRGPVVELPREPAGEREGAQSRGELGFGVVFSWKEREERVLQR